MNKNKILDYIYPPRCPICGGIFDGGICPLCRKELIYITEDFCLKCGRPLINGREEYCLECKKKKHAYIQGRALFSYAGPLKTSMYRLKYAGKREYAEIYGTEIAKHLESWIRTRGITLIVPIPLHPSKQQKRGYNQAADIARSLGKNLNLTVDDKLLIRVKKTRPQKELDDKDRKINLKNAFAVAGDIKAGERILLIDDIYTTGSTVDSAATSLLVSAKCQIYVITVAIGG